MHAGIDFVVRVDSAHRVVGEIPFSGVEAVSLVDKSGGVFALTHFPPEGGLAAVGVASPFVEDQHSGEGFQISYSFQHGCGEVVEDLSLQGVNYVARAEVQAWLAADCGS